MQGDAVPLNDSLRGRGCLSELPCGILRKTDPSGRANPGIIVGNPILVHHNHRTSLRNLNDVHTPYKETMISISVSQTLTEEEKSKLDFVSLFCVVER